MKPLTFFLSLSSILIVLIFSACDQAKDPSVIDPDLLLNCWTHVHEEGLEEGRYFQPCDFSDLPASRYRATYHLQEGGSCTYSVLSPIDAHYSLTGTWDYNTKNASLKIYDANQALVLDLEVLELTENRMIVSP